MSRGYFITLEGGEGAGKSTLAREVETYNLDRRPLVMTLFHDLSAAVSRSRAA